MDITRFSLYGALAIVTYLMLLAWQEDYPPVIDSITNTEATSAVANDLPDTPSVQAPDTQINSTPTTAAVSTPSINTTQSDAAGSISITTDTLKLNVELKGGDITSLALPQYLKQLNVRDDPFELLEQNFTRSYVAQSGLIGRDGIDNSNRALYSASQTTYELAEGENQLNVDLITRTESGIEIIKRLSFERGSYLIDVSFIVTNTSESAFQANAFGQIKRDGFDDPSSAGGFGRTYLGFVTTSADDPYIRIDFEDIDDASLTTDVVGGWIGFSQHYFISVWIPPVSDTNRFTTRKNDSTQYFGEFTGSAFSVPAGSTGQYDMQFYAGPKEQYELAEIAPNLELTIDYGFLFFLAAPIYWLLTQIDSVIGNYGFSNIALTFVVKALFYKLSETQYRSMAGMRRLMPKMQQLKESYGDDRMKLQQATMELYKKEKINPFGGCLPMLVQMPVFISLYWVLMESVELRHAPFMLWLQDLSVRDPYSILPLLMAGSMYLQTSLSPTPADPMQAKVMKLMPVMMGVLFLWFPAGLVLYWLTNGVLSIAQQWYITRKIEASYAAK